MDLFCRKNDGTLKKGWGSPTLVPNLVFCEDKNKRSEACSSSFTALLVVKKQVHKS